jgi:glycerate kinase
VHILIAPDSFKGSLSAKEASENIAAGIRQVFPDAVTVLLPVADGGEGTADAVLAALGGRKEQRVVTGPYGKKTQASFAVLDGGDVVIECASAVGLTLTRPEERMIMEATSFGLGELIRYALDFKPPHLYIGLGGSATNDAGAGMAQALGAKITDANGREIASGAKGLKDAAHVGLNGLDGRLRETQVCIISDVDNPLCGPLGASAVYGAQKGAAEAEIALLDAYLARFARIAGEAAGMRCEDEKGAGAAGGLGWALMAFARGTVRSGIDFMLDLLNFDARAREADIVFTGEGKIDAQSAYGKVLSGIGRRAKAAGKPVIALGGIVEPGAAEALEKMGVTALESTYTMPCELDEAMRRAPERLRLAAARAAQMIKIGMLKEKRNCE